jgi:hypothetical protein
VEFSGSAPDQEVERDGEEDREVQTPANRWVELGDVIEKYWEPVLAFVGVFLFAVRYLSYLAFYAPFGVSPEEVGLGWSEALLQAIIATTIFAAAMGFYFAFTARESWLFGKLVGGRVKSPWRFLGGGVALAVGSLQVCLVFGALWYGTRAEDGEPLGNRSIPSYLEWRAERVKVRIIGDAISDLSLSSDDCTLYLGKADGTAVLWNFTDKQTVRIPESKIALEMGQEQKACS